ncbi:glycosyl transferase [Allomyces arbusculus]|nr:glycosyl transferase [Allomyces arbusculus]
MDAAARPPPHTARRRRGSHPHRLHEDLHKTAAAKSTKSSPTRILVAFFAAATAIKLLLVPGYRSTDFEVHRNWLAITHSLPLKQWYYDATSEWTLDYPPFFAYFEWVLAQIAARVADPAMLVVSNLNYASWSTVVFQRVSVMVTDSTLLAGLALFFSASVARDRTSAVIPAGILVLLNAGLLVVDHMHFQYNGFMFGLLLIAMAFFHRSHPYLGAFVFAALLNFKHIYLYVAPAVFVYLLSGFCLDNGKWHLNRFVTLGLIVLATFAVSLAPFRDYLPQLVSRLFPFKRGLCHAYWAPNVWALYAFLDRAAMTVLPRLFGISIKSVAAMTRGLVGDVEFSVLPNVLPVHTLVLTLLAQLPGLVSLWRRPTMPNFVRVLVLCGFAAFLFGWHVHEKAVLTMVLPLGLIVVQSMAVSHIAFVLAVVGSYSLFPLVFEVTDVTTRWGLLLSFAALLWLALDSYHRRHSHAPFTLPWPVRVYLGGLFVVEWFVVAGHAILLGDKLPFLPLMAVSVYCAVGVIACWVALLRAQV